MAQEDKYQTGKSRTGRNVKFDSEHEEDTDHPVDKVTFRGTMKAMASMPDPATL